MLHSAVGVAKASFFFKEAHTFTDHKLSRGCSETESNNSWAKREEFNPEKWW